jgi:hypothetical protein
MRPIIKPGKRIPGRMPAHRQGRFIGRILLYQSLMPLLVIFDKYLNCLIKASIPEKRRRWYVKRVNEFIKAQDGRKIKTLMLIDIARHFEMIGRKNRLNGWQYQQCISAIGILYCELLKTRVCQDIDRDFWIDFARQLELNHPTTTKELISSIDLGPVY